MMMRVDVCKFPASKNLFYREGEKKKGEVVHSKSTWNWDIFPGEKKYQDKQDLSQYIVFIILVERVQALKQMNEG